MSNTKSHYNCEEDLFAEHLSVQILNADEEVIAEYHAACPVDGKKGYNLYDWDNIYVGEFTYNELEAAAWEHYEQHKKRKNWPKLAAGLFDKLTGKNS
jgi:hypothetical protein